MNYPRMDVCLESNYLEDTFVPIWHSNDAKPDVNKIEQEKKEEIEATEYLIKKGILKRRKMSITLDDNQLIKDMQIRVTPPQLTKIKNHELYDSCPCGNKEMLKDCVDCLRRLQIIK